MIVKEKIEAALKTKFEGFEISSLMDLMMSAEKLHYKNRQFYREAISKLSSMNLRSPDAGRVAHIVWGLAKSNIKSHVQASDYNTFLEYLAEKANKIGIDRFHSFQIVKLAWGFGKIGFFNKMVFQEISNYVVQNIDKFEVFEMITVLTSFAYLKIRDERVCSVISKRALATHFDGFNEQDLANLIYAQATLGIKDEKLLPEAVVYAKKIFHTLKPQALSNIAWGLATFKTGHDLFENIAKRCIEMNFERFQPADMGLIAWSFATLNLKDENLFYCIADKCLANKFRGFNTENLAKIAWSFATLTICDRKLFSVFSESFQSLMFKNKEASLGQHLSMVARAFSKLGIEDTALFNACKKLFQSQDTQSFDSQTLSLLASSEVMIGNKSGEYLTMLADNMIKINFKNAKPEHVSRILWALARCEVYHDIFVERAAKELVKYHQEEFTTKDLGVLLYSLAVYDIVDSPLISIAIERLKNLAIDEEFTFSVGEILWSLAVLNKNEPVLFQRMLDLTAKCYKKFAEQSQKDLEIHCNQLCQFRTYCEVAGISLQWDAKLLKLIDIQMDLLIQNPPKSTYDHRRVLWILSRMVCSSSEIELRSETFALGFFVDIVINILKGGNIIQVIPLEIMGDMHYTAANELRSEDKFKEQILAALFGNYIEIRNNEIRHLDDNELTAFILRRIPKLAEILSPFALEKDQLVSKPFIPLMAKPISKPKLSALAASFVPSEKVEILSTTRLSAVAAPSVPFDSEPDVIPISKLGEFANNFFKSDHPGFSPKVLVQIAWSLGNLGVRNMKLFQKIARYTKNNVDLFSKTELIYILWSFAKFKIRDEELIDMLPGYVSVEGLEHVPFKVCALLAFSLAQFNLGVKPYIDIILQQLIVQLKAAPFNPSDAETVPELLLSLSLLNVQDSALFNLILGSTQQYVTVLEQAPEERQNSNALKLQLFKECCDTQSIALSSWSPDFERLAKPAMESKNRSKSKFL